MAVKQNLLIIAGVLFVDYITTTILSFAGVDAALYGNYLFFVNALVVLWLVLPSKKESILSAYLSSDAPAAPPFVAPPASAPPLYLIE